MSDEEPQLPSVSDALSEAVRKSKLSNLSPDDQPTGKAILAAIGGVRGLIESVLPSFVFLVVYLVTKDVIISALVPVGIALIFVVVRYGRKEPVTPAITGAIGVGITAGLAILTNRAENNFIPGILINVGFLVAMLISLAARRPLVGVIVAILLGEEAAGWRANRRQRRTLTLATWLWAGMFALRLVVEVPLYFAGNVEGLAIAKLILGVPLYAAVLWVTWLLVRSVFPPKAVETDSE